MKNFFRRGNAKIGSETTAGNAPTRRGLFSGFSTARVREILTLSPTIFSAISRGNLKQFENLIADGADLNITRGGISALKHLISTPYARKSYFRNNLNKDAATRMAQIFIEHGSNSNEVLRLAHEFKKPEIVKLALQKGAIIDHHITRSLSQEGAFISHAIANHDIEALELLANAGMSFHGGIGMLPFLMFAIKSFADEKDPEELAKIKTFLIKAATIMFAAGASIDSKEYSTVEFSADGQILSHNESLVDYALQHEYSCDIAKMIVARGGIQEVNQAMSKALSEVNINSLKRAFSVGADLEGYHKSLLTYAVRNNKSTPREKEEIADILMQAGLDISFVKQEELAVLSQIDDSNVFNHIVLFTILTQGANPNNWASVQNHLQDSQQMRVGLSPINKYLLKTYLPDGELKSGIVSEEIQQGDLANLTQTNQNRLLLFLPEGELKTSLNSLIENPSDRSNRLDKLLEIKQDMISRLAQNKHPNPELAASSFVIDLALNPKKLLEAVESHKEVAGVYPTKGHDSTLMKACEKNTNQDLPEIVAAEIQSYISATEGLSNEENFYGNMALEKLLNPSSSLSNAGKERLLPESKEQEKT